MSNVLILGGYGNFGKRISLALAKANIPIIIAGRSDVNAKSLQSDILQQYPNADVNIAVLNVDTLTTNELQKINPKIVINTCGPFQLRDYAIAESCIAAGVHYIDLADGRDFVSNITTLNAKAKQNNVLIVSGASTVPGLSSAVIEYFQPEFSEIDLLVYGISPGQKSPRGLATAKSILTYLGKPFKNANHEIIYGWQNIYRQKYPELGNRWMANCDIPDLELFPKKYKIKHMQFSAGMESTNLHLGMWLMSWLVRLGLAPDLSQHAESLLRLSNQFDRFGTDAGGMHMLIQGKDRKGNPLEIKWFIIAKDGDGPQIPCVPAIVLSKKLLANSIDFRGAYPCVGLISLDEYLSELKDFSIKQHIQR